MFYKKKGHPEVGELVFCTVKKVLYHSVFVILDEYEHLEGMLHISEVAPGRIRTIRDYVKEGKKIVCKVLRIDKVKGHIDLSLRRVTSSQKKNKNEEYKQEQKAEKLLEGVGVKFKFSLADMYKRVGDKIIEKFGSLTEGFYAVVEDNVSLSKEIGIDVKIASEIEKVVKEKIKPVSVEVSGVIEASVESVDKLKEIFKQMQNIKDYDIKISYIGAPKYLLKVVSSDFKTAEAILSEVVEMGEKLFKKEGGSFEFNKKKKDA